jgi:hypothetical protein
MTCIDARWLVSFVQMKHVTLIAITLCMVVASSMVASASVPIHDMMSINEVNANNVSINIHLKLDIATEALAQLYDAKLHAALPSNDIWLRTIHQPHITLYLTAFQITTTLDELISTLNEGLALITSQMNQCRTTLLDVFASGTYGMWRVANETCIQIQSDLVVDTLFRFAVPNQPIPDWVYSLPGLCTLTFPFIFSLFRRLIDRTGIVSLQNLCVRRKLK